MNAWVENSPCDTFSPKFVKTLTILWQGRRGKIRTVAGHCHERQYSNGLSKESTGSLSQEPLAAALQMTYASSMQTPRWVTVGYCRVICGVGGNDHLALEGERRIH